MGDVSCIMRIARNILRVIGITTFLIAAIVGWYIYDNLSSYKTPEWVTEELVKQKHSKIFSDVDRIISTESSVDRNKLIEELGNNLLNKPGAIYSMTFIYEAKLEKNRSFIPNPSYGIYKTYIERISLLNYGDTAFERLKGYSTKGNTYDLLRYKVIPNKPYIKSIVIEFFTKKLK